MNYCPIDELPAFSFGVLLFGSEFFQSFFRCYSIFITSLLPFPFPLFTANQVGYSTQSNWSKQWWFRGRWVYLYLSSSGSPQLIKLINSEPKRRRRRSGEEEEEEAKEKQKMGQKRSHLTMAEFEICISNSSIIYVSM
jgi:hypothetical protein